VDRNKGICKLLYENAMTKIILVNIGILLAIMLFGLAIAQIRVSQEVGDIWRSLKSPPTQQNFIPDMVAELPEPVQRYFLHAIAPNTPLATSVKITMSGSMRLAPNKNWMPLQAKEMLSNKGFMWEATAGQGIMQLRGEDYYSKGTGRMRFSLWGLIPVVNAHNPDIVRSSIGRWAGEFCWLPSTLLPQHGVSWQVIDKHTIQPSFQADGIPTTLTLTIDDRGRLLRCTIPRWGDQTEDGHHAEIPFGGENQAEQTFGGYTIPSQMGAGWWIGTDRYFEFIRMTFEHAQFY
jgi:hypothetical protein